MQQQPHFGQRVFVSAQEVLLLLQYSAAHYGRRKDLYLAGNNGPRRSAATGLKTEL